MHALFILFLITTAGARRSSYDLPQQPNYKVFDNYANNEQFDTVKQGIDFGHVYRNGFKGSSYNPQFDHDGEAPEPPEYSEKIKDTVKKSRNSKLNLKDQPLVFLSPRDEILHDRKLHAQSKSNNGKETISSNKRLKPNSQPMLYDFTKLLERNLANPFANGGDQAFKEKYYKRIGKVESTVKEPKLNPSVYFDRKTFLKKSNKDKFNWTTCNEFAKRAVFHPDDVVNTKWLPFYIWSTREERRPSVIHTFSYPTKKLVQFFKTTYAPYIRKLNWKQPKLLLKEGRDILLIAGDRKGLFYGIPKQELPSAVKGKNITLPLITLRMKIHDPYLAMMYCEDNYAVIMAELGTEPQSDQDKTLEASTLQFRGKGRTVYRDLEAEAMLERMEREKRIEAESRKIIQIPTPTGDVDLEVRH